MSTVSTSRSTGQEADSAQGGNEMSLPETKREAWLTKMLSFYDLEKKKLYQLNRVTLVDLCGSDLLSDVSVSSIKLKT